MSLAVVHTRAKVGIEAPLVTVEVHLSNGLPGLTMVGLPETAVKESRDRVRSAILNAHFEFPQRRITVNLAPADLPKEGGRFDLAIALGILVASGQVPGKDLESCEVLGELALTGELRPVQGALPASMAAIECQRILVVPLQNTEEACLPDQAQVYGAGHLLDVCAHLSGQQRLSLYEKQQTSSALPDADLMDISDVKGQQAAKRALEVAAAGRHNLLFYGPPGTGKTLLASRLPGIMPTMSDQEMLEVAAVYSISGQHQHHYRLRPFRAPHHTASGVALVGGGCEI
ncbi:YifB family Mg chelatase-like AAA ATPase [Gynuella sunshinyii]|uniref:Putative ATPase with chaperone activity n=1 Tax=Gynuella sunshinyii YC6258 TaxID=1445510 RepID=A0A0C5VG11_9GAMM|nr:putative ATPase with chaperone activity [Gynuella sunshinyii YC6258]